MCYITPNDEFQYYSKKKFEEYVSFLKTTAGLIGPKQEINDYKFEPKVI